MSNQELFKEIELIQSCINRMAKNSFMVKGWALTIFAAVIAITKDELFDDMLLLIPMVLIPFVCFWMLDAFFLRTERMYGKMYAWVLQERKRGNIEYQYDLNPARFSDEVECICKVMFSKTLLLFFGIPTMSLLIIVIFKMCFLTSC